MRFRMSLAFAAAVLVATACDGPAAGELSIDLVSPNGGDGAILFKVKTPSPREFGAVTAMCSDCQAFVYRATSSELYCAVTGQLESGPLARIMVSDVNPMSVYELQILDVSGADRRIRSKAGYELRLSY